MKLKSKVLIGNALTLAILLVAIALVNAQPPIGTTLQKNPFESKPSTHTATGTTVNSGNLMYDGVLGSSGFFFLGDTYPYVGDVEFSGFGSPATTFTIGWVDIRIKYTIGFLTDDTYSWEYTTDGTNWIDLVPTTSSQFDLGTPPLPQIRSWSQKLPNDGTWDWTDISDLKVRVSFDAGAWTDYVYMYVYDVWVTVYKPPLPPSGSTGMSIQPPAVETLPVGPPFFVEVYAQNVTALAGYQFTINFNTTVLTPLPLGWGYYPWTDAGPSSLNDTYGYVSLTYTIPISDPLYTTGVTGNFSLCRIYFKVDAGMTASDYSFLTFSTSLLGDPVPTRIVHREYHGLYGTPPATTHLMAWPPASDFPYDAPISTEWDELWPDDTRKWHLSSWEENTDGRLGPSDQIDMTMLEPPTGEVWWFHVDETWESNADPDTYVYMICTFKYKEPVPEFPLGLGIIMMLAPLIPIVYIWRMRKKVVAK